MRRLFGLLLLCLIVLNTVGYYGLLLVVKNQLNRKVLQRIETNANELGGNLILTIPIQLPYSYDSDEYTSSEGEIIYEGEVYRFVKQRFYQDMLYLVCIKDNQSTRIRDQIADYSRLFSGFDAAHTDSTIKIINSLFKDYASVICSVKNESEGWAMNFDLMQLKNLYHFISDTSFFHPPRYS